MNVSLLAISIGNTRTRLGMFEEGELVQHAAVDNRHEVDMAAWLREASVVWKGDRAMIPVVLASVNPAMTQKLRAMAMEAFPTASVMRVETDVPIAIGRQLDHESMVGEDRLLNAAAAYNVLKQACVVVDAGTAITIDFIDGAGTFHGGAIGPGAQMMLTSMHEHTAQLPEVEMDIPTEPIGHNTVQAMRSAVYHGLRGMVRELVEQYAEVAGTYPMVIATGGSADLLFKDDPFIERMVPDLTLIGLAVSWQRHVDEE